MREAEGGAARDDLSGKYQGGNSGDMRARWTWGRRTGQRSTRALGRPGVCRSYNGVRMAWYARPEPNRKIYAGGRRLDSGRRHLSRFVPRRDLERRPEIRVQERAAATEPA